MASRTTRRTFLRQSGTAVAGAAALGAGFPVHVRGSDEIRFAVIGCGGRGTGAADQIRSTKAATRQVALADPIAGRMEECTRQLAERHGGKVDVAQERAFGGLQGYKAAIDAGVDLVVIATPPGFKPQQFEYAVASGVHVFMEKPVATDAPGVRRVLAANEIAVQKSLLVAVGLQRRHEAKYVDCVKRLQDGAIGDIPLLRVYWNGSGIWYRDREPGMTEMQFQVNNWYHFIWTCGDQICEQHIHNIDVGCWVKGAYPIEANGMGGGERRMDGDRSKSQIFDHTFVEFTFADGSRMYSQGRHLGNAFQRVGEFAHGTKGTSRIGETIEPFGAAAIRMTGASNGHEQEQHDLIAALCRGEVYNEGDYGAMSTFTAILGREACYSGRVLRADELLARGRDYAPGIDAYTLESMPPVVRGADGRYPAPIPGLHDPFG